jgi:hypothetical protein
MKNKYRKESFNWYFSSNIFTVIMKTKWSGHVLPKEETVNAFENLIRREGCRCMLEYNFRRGIQEIRCEGVK